MKCDICDQEFSQGHIVFGVGCVCSVECEQIAQGRIKAMHDKLLAEPLTEMPEAFETHDFERWSLKLALHMLRDIEPIVKKKLCDNNPLMLVPENLSLELKDKIIARLPKRFVSEVEARGHARMFYGGTYCFRQSVPRDIVIEACRKAEILQ